MAAPMDNLNFGQNNSIMDQNRQSNHQYQQAMTPQQNFRPQQYIPQQTAMHGQHFNANFPNSHEFSRPPPFPRSTMPHTNRFGSPRANQIHPSELPMNRFQGPPPGLLGNGFNKTDGFPLETHNFQPRTNIAADNTRFQKPMFFQPQLPDAAHLNAYPPRHQGIGNRNEAQPNCDDDFSGGDRSLNKLQKQHDIQRSEDSAWINNFVKKTSENNAETKSKIPCVSEMQDKTRHMMVLLAKLQKNRQMLETMKNEDSTIWEQKLKEVTKLKTEVEVAQKELTSSEAVRILQKKIKKSRQKRVRIKRLRHQRYEQKQTELTAREEKHALIDKEMQQIIEKQKLKKQEEDMQKEADEILGQVRKKISEATKCQQLIQGLQKLRNLRADRLERQGVLNIYGTQGGSSAQKLMFEARLSNLTELLSKQMTVYKSEEGALQVLLETEHKETREKEQEKSRLRLAEKVQSEHRRHARMLFGTQKPVVPDSPLYPFQQFYNAASNSLHDLISIRRDWDMYLAVPGTPGASCIPQHFVHPTEPISDTWATALADKNT